MPAAFLHRLAQAAEVTDGCLLCWLEGYQVERYLTGVASDGVNNIPLRLKLARRGGYCAPHTRAFARIANPLSGAILLESFLKQRLTSAGAGNRPTRLDCEACEIATKARRNLAKNIKRHRSNAALQTRLGEARLCLEHIELACRALPLAARQAIIQRHDALRGHLAEVIRKHDYRVTEAMTEDEKQSIARALELF